MEGQQEDIMTIEQLRKDMIAAAKAGDKERKNVLSALVSEELVGRAVTKELRAAKESLDTCPPSREDLIAEYTYRYNVIAEYAPHMMSRDEIRSFLTNNCAEVLATKNKGQIMKTVMPLLKGKADGKEISQVVAELTK